MDKNLIDNAGYASISVVIPCYRCSTTIGRAIASIEGQTLKPAQIILVDDASEDGTLSILHAIAQNYPNWITVLKSSVNQGAASARNAGWKAASQPYIAFLDADDAWHPKKIEIQYRYMMDNPDVMLSGHHYRELPADLIIIPHWPVALKSTKKITWPFLLLKNEFVTPSVMLKREIPFRFSAGKRHVDDHLLWLSIVGAGMSAVKLDIDLAAIFKPMYGASGLSSELWLMEKAELSNYRQLRNEGKLSFWFYLFLMGFSFCKFVRRLIIVHIVRRFKSK